MDDKVEQFSAELLNILINILNPAEDYLQEIRSQAAYPLDDRECQLIYVYSAGLSEQEASMLASLMHQHKLTGSSIIGQAVSALISKSILHVLMKGVHDHTLVYAPPIATPKVIH